MSSRGPDERDEETRRKRRRGDASAPADEHAAAQSPAEESAAPEGEAEERNPLPGSLPPGMRDEPLVRPEAAPIIAEAVGENADPDAVPPAFRLSASPNARDRPAQPEQEDAFPPGYGQPTAPPSAERRDRFGWPLPEGMDAGASEERPTAPERQSPPGQRDEPTRPAASYNPYDTSAWRTPPAPDTPPRGPYSGQIPVQQPNSCCAAPWRLFRAAPDASARAESTTARPILRSIPYRAAATVPERRLPDRATWPGTAQRPVARSTRCHAQRVFRARRAGARRPSQRRIPNCAGCGLSERALCRPARSAQLRSCPLWPDPAEPVHQRADAASPAKRAIRLSGRGDEHGQPPSSSRPTPGSAHC